MTRALRIADTAKLLLIGAAGAAFSAGLSAQDATTIPAPEVPISQPQPPDTQSTAPIAPVPAPEIQSSAPIVPAPVPAPAAPTSTPIAPAAAPSPKSAAAAEKAARIGEVGRVRNDLAGLTADPVLAARVPADALMQARSALSAAESAQGDADNGPHFLYLADRRVQLARALAETAAAQAQFQQLQAQRAGAPAANGGGSAGIAPRVIDTPQQEELQRGAAALHPQRDRGALRFTVDDVIVLPGTVTLTRDASNGLVALSVYLRRNPESQLVLTGHARGAESDESVQRTAQARADGVRNYLMHLGVQVEQITLETRTSSSESECLRCVDAILDPPYSAPIN